MPGFNDATINSSVEYRQSQLLRSAGERDSAPIVRWARRNIGFLVVRLGERLAGDLPTTANAPTPPGLVMS
jgi:hypothetical protein